MRIIEHIFTALQGFGFGAIVMAYMTNYNKGQLPIAMVLLIISIISRIASNKI